SPTSRAATHRSRLPATPTTPPRRTQRPSHHPSGNTPHTQHLPPVSGSSDGHHFLKPTNPPERVFATWGAGPTPTNVPSAAGIQPHPSPSAPASACSSSGQPRSAPEHCAGTAPSTDGDTPKHSLPSSASSASDSSPPPSRSYATSPPSTA